MIGLIPFGLVALSAVVPTALCQRTGTTRGQVFMGCNPDWPAIGDETRWAVDSSTTYANGLDCANACASGNGSVSYWSATDRTCKCSYVYPGQYDNVHGNPGSCPNGSNGSGANEVYRLRTTFATYQSYPCRALSSITISFQTSSSNINACFQQCKASTYAIWVPKGSDNYQCACTNNAQTSGMNSNSVICDKNTAFVYVHSAQAQASQLDRKRRRLEAQVANVSKLCPGKTTACRIAGHEDGYECIDTRSELESCGGCRHGSLESHNITAIGLDCTSLGAAIGASTCSNGRCVITACAQGKTLIDGGCW